MKLLLIFIATVLCATHFVKAHDKKVLCYYGSWAIYRQGDAKFSSSEIDPFLCTHVAYSFFGVTPDGTIKSLDDWADNGLGNIAKLNDLKKQNPKLKTLLVVGGWTEGTTNYKAIAADANKQKTFINSAISLIKKYNFDGLDVDWEYPVFPERGGSPQDKDNFTKWMKACKDALSPLGYSLSAAVYAAGPKAGLAYDIKAISQTLDFINVMTYDLYGNWDRRTGCHTAQEGTENKDLNVKASIEYWIKEGCPPEKLVLGIGTYGQSFTLESAQNNGVGAATLGPGAAGDHTKQAGFLGYYEIMKKVCAGTMKSTFHSTLKVPIGVEDRLWVSYDNPQSIKSKVNDIVLPKNLGGCMIWSIETDDFKGLYGTKFPLLKAINNALDKKSNAENDNQACKASVETSVPNVSNTTPAPPTTTTASSGGSTSTNTGSTGCPSTTLLPDSSDCAKYITCVGATAYTMSCSPPLLFNPITKNCDWAANVKCNN